VKLWVNSFQKEMVGSNSQNIHTCHQTKGPRPDPKKKGKPEMATKSILFSKDPSGIGKGDREKEVHNNESSNQTGGAKRQKSLVLETAKKEKAEDYSKRPYLAIRGNRKECVRS